MAFEGLLGSRLLSKDGEVATADAVAGKKNVMLYFSAHWCPPCRGFTPQLAKAYKEYSRTGTETMIVFVSSDQGQKEFDEYYGEQPWHALPYSERDTKGKLSAEFGVSGIPSLIVLDDQGNVVTKNGRAEYMSYLQASVAAPPSAASEELVNLVGSKLISKEGEVSSTDALAGAKHVMLYFSAHWCPPCRGFTPQLAKAYKESAIAGKDTIVIFVSSDQGQAQFDEYYAEMPWLAVPYSDRECQQKLNQLFGVQGIPTLVVVDGDGKLVTKNGRAEYQSYLGSAAAGPEVVKGKACGGNGCVIC